MPSKSGLSTVVQNTERSTEQGVKKIKRYLGLDEGEYGLSLGGLSQE